MVKGFGVTWFCGDKADKYLKKQEKDYNLILKQKFLIKIYTFLFNV